MCRFMDTFILSLIFLVASAARLFVRRSEQDPEPFHEGCALHGRPTPDDHVRLHHLQLHGPRRHPHHLLRQSVGGTQVGQP